MVAVAFEACMKSFALTLALVKHKLYNCMRRKDVKSMATKSITVRVDEEVKTQAESILEDIGINVTTLINACLKAVIRERQVPFALACKDADKPINITLTSESTLAREWLTPEDDLAWANMDYRNVIKGKLEESLAIAADPNAKRYTHEEIFAPLREKYGYGV